jgi:vacuolar-type H+-ATPase subunit E/Vma4
MSLEKLLEKIEDEEAMIRTKLLDDAKKEIQELQKESNKEITRETENLWVQTKKQSEIEKNSLIVKCEIDSRKKILIEKRKIIDEVFKKFENFLINMSFEDYKNWFQKKIYENKIDLNQGFLRIGSSKKNEVELKKFLLEKLKNKNVKFDESINWGFVFEKENIKFDFTLDSVIEDYKQKEEQEVVKILFHDYL